MSYASYASQKKLQRVQEKLRKSQDELAIFAKIQELENERLANEEELRAQKQAQKQERQAQKQAQKQARQAKKQEQAEFKTAQAAVSVLLDKARTLCDEKQKRINNARSELQAAM